MADTRKTVFGILKLLPFPVITAMIVLLWVDDFVAIMMFAFLWFVTLPAIVLSIVFFVQGLKWRDGWQRTMVIWGGVNLLFFLVYLFAEEPNRNCNPDIMEKHYEKHRAEMEELHRYVHEAVGDDCAVTLEFDGKKVEMFHVCGPDSNIYSHYWNEEANDHRDSLMAVVGLTQEEFDGIHQRLHDMGCVGIQYAQSNPDELYIWFRRVGLGRYDYIVYNRPMTEEERAGALESMSQIPYNDRCVFGFGGGAIGPQVFAPGVKDEYLAKHQPW